MNSAKYVLLLALIAVVGAIIPQARTNGLFVIASFPSLVDDLELIACPGDRIDYLVPYGVDPHEYTLTPSDIEIIKKADLIVTTGHTSFEAKISEMAEKGEIKARVIEIPKIPGIVVRKNPVLGTPNYHMPIYDPGNFITYMEYLAREMARLNPSCKTYYFERISSIRKQVERVVASTPKLSIDAVADSPVVQYAVEWIGIKLKYLVVAEHGLQANPDLAVVEKALIEGKIGLVVVTEQYRSKYSEWLIKKAIETGIPVLLIPSPMSKGTTIEKLRYVSLQVASIASSIQNYNVSAEHSRVNRRFYVIDYVAIALGILVYALMLTAIWCREK